MLENVSFVWIVDPCYVVAARLPVRLEYVGPFQPSSLHVFCDFPHVNSARVASLQQYRSAPSLS